jgi:4-amino-4-deoxy-L-arabinose transferase-like glycosyltransferase
VTQTDNPSRDDVSLSMTARAFWLVLIIATLYFCYFHNLGAIGLVGPDEPRYAWIAREMYESGDWVTPRLYGQPWFEKPVLLYWGAALSFKLFGVSEAAARFPSALAALLATLAMAWLAWRVYGPWTARWLLLLLPTTVGMIGFSHAAATDMPFAGTLTVALVFATIILGLTRNKQSPPFQRTPWLALIFFGFFLGLATLAKGPAAILLSGGGVLLWAAFTRRWRDAFRCLHPVAISSFCLTALPWYIICSRRNPDFFRIFIIEHNFKRYLTPEFQHIQPFWFYVPVLLIAFAPWTLALVWSTFFATLRAWPQRRPSDATLLALCWAVFCLVFFSISKSKLPGYILPAVPAIALLLARSCASLTPEAERTFRWIRLGFSFLGFPVAFVLFWGGWLYAVSTNQRQRMISAALVLLLLGLANLLLANLGSRNHSLRLTAPLCVVPVLILVVSFNPIARPWLTLDPSGKSLALLLEQFQSLGLPDTEFYVPPMKRGQQFGLSFYLHREIQVWDPENPRKGFLLLPVRDCDSNLVKAPWGCSRRAEELGSTGWFLHRVFPENPRSTRK